jgi:hypothetical protein
VLSKILVIISDIDGRVRTGGVTLCTAYSESTQFESRLENRLLPRILSVL